MGMYRDRHKNVCRSMLTINNNTLAILEYLFIYKSSTQKIHVASCAIFDCCTEFDPSHGLNSGHTMGMSQ